jgi:hypothetical protein
VSLLARSSSSAGFAHSKHHVNVHVGEAVAKPLGFPAEVESRRVHEIGLVTVPIPASTVDNR